jgi:hypothetical protein
MDLYHGPGALATVFRNQITGTDTIQTSSTGGILGSAGYAHKIPAQLCYENSSKLADGTLSFSATNCYVGY